MKTLLTSTLTALLAIAILVPAEAAWYAKFNGIDAKVKKTAQAMEDLKSAENEQAIALLLPAIQKVREAANRVQVQCTDPNGNEGDVACAAQTLSDLILASGPDRGGSPGLMELLGVGQGTHIKEVKITCRREASNGAAGVEHMLVGILIGLLKETQTQGITDPSVLDPIVSAVLEADEIDPDAKSVKRGKVEYDLKYMRK